MSEQAARGIDRRYEEDNGLTEVAELRVANYLLKLQESLDPVREPNIYNRSGAEGILQAYDSSPEVQEMILSSVGQRDCSSTQAVRQVDSRLIYENYQDLSNFVPRDGVSGPTEHESARPEWWRDKLVVDAENPMRRWAFQRDVLKHTLQSTISSRIKSVRIIAHCRREQLGMAPTLIDDGCGLNHAAKHLAGVWEFAPVVVEAEGVGEVEEKLLQAQVNATLYSSHHAGGEALGIDLQNPTGRSRERACADAFHKSEIVDPSERERFDTLELADPPNVRFAIADMRTMGRLRQAPDEGFDIGHVSWSTYLIPTDEERRQAHENIRANLSENGVEIVTEPAYPDPADPQHLIYREDDWFPAGEPYPINTMVYDMRQPEEGYRVFMSWSDGRMKRGRLSSYGVSLLEQAW